MFSKKEIISMVIAALMMSLILMFNQDILETDYFAFYCVISIFVILLFIVSKKLIARHLDIDIKIKNWELSRYWITAKAHLKHPIPAGIIFPLVFAFASSGYLKMLTFLQFESSALPAKAVKKYGLKRFSEVMEWDDAQIAFYSIGSLLLLAVFASLISGDFFSALSRTSLYFAAWNLIPFSKLDGTKLFMGSRPLYVFTLILTAIAALIVIL